MNNWTIRQRIVASLGVILVLILVMGGMSWMELRRIDAEVYELRRNSLPGLEYDIDLAAAFTTNYLLTERYARLEDRQAMDALAMELADNQAQLDALMSKYETTVFANENRELFDKLQSARAAYFQTQMQVLRPGDVSQAAESSGLLSAQLATQFENLRQALQNLTAFDRKHTDGTMDEITASVAQGTMSIVMSFIAALVIAALCGHFLMRAIMAPLSHLLRTTQIVSKGDFTRRIQLDRRDEFGALAEAFDRMIVELNNLIDQVQRSAIQVNASVTQIGATANEQQATAAEIAATTTEIGATSKQISATSRELARTMNEVAAVAEQTAGLAGNGQSGLARMEATMQQVTQAAAAINAKLVVLNEKATNIYQVVTTITKVADQTNLLSLNAAIEAEKAGEVGRGFAVVASEIRRLADQTGVATYDIEQTVKEIQSAVAAGVMGMDKFSEEVRRGMHEVQQVGEQLSQIIHQVQTLAPRCVAASEAMHAQATGAEQISDALSQLTEASQQTAESLGQSNQAIGGLTGVASGLRNSVAEFRLQTA